jgi:hypothetical protein
MVFKFDGENGFKEIFNKPFSWVHKKFSLSRRIDMRLYTCHLIYKAKNFYAPFLFKNN